MKRLLLALSFLISMYAGAQECEAPGEGIISEITPYSATVAWTAGGDEMTWEIVVLPSGSALPSETEQGAFPASANPFTVTNLAPGTCYDFYVRAVCSETEKSPWNLTGSTCTALANLGCGGHYVDNGGATANYLPNSNSVVTICPENIGDVVEVVFTFFEVEPLFDGLYVYNGNSTSSPMIPSSNGPGNNAAIATPGAYWGTSLPGPFVSTSPDGCLTFQFISDNENNLGGFIANVNCNSSPILELKTYVDTNGDNQMNAGELPFTHGSFEITNTATGTEPWQFYTSGSSVFYHVTTNQEYQVNYTIYPEYQDFFTVVNGSFLVDGSANPLFYPVAVIPTGTFENVSAMLTEIVPPVPGMSSKIRLFLTNEGLSAQSGTVSFTADSSIPGITTVPATTAIPGGFNYNFSLQPNQTVSIDVDLLIDVIPTVELGQLLHHSVSLVSWNDTIPADDNFSLTQQIIGSYDPNDINEVHGSEIPIDAFTGEDYLYYTIRFQNTGTAPAFNVRLENTLDSQLDSSSLRVVAGSHLNQLEQSGNQLTWKFNNIMLPAEQDNEPASHGFVVYKIKPIPGFEIGDVIPNTAEIYFDFNPAIITNTFETAFVAPLLVHDASRIGAVLYPNPASGSFHVTSGAGIREISVYNLVGNKILTEITDNRNDVAIDIRTFAKGVYLVEVTSATSAKQTVILIVK